MVKQFPINKILSYFKHIRKIKTISSRDSGAHPMEIQVHVTMTYSSPCHKDIHKKILVESHKH